MLVCFFVLAQNVAGGALGSQFVAEAATLKEIKIQGSFSGSSEVQFSVKGTDNDGTPVTIANKDVTWTSNNTNVATVMEGKVSFTGVGGTVTITATSPDGISDSISTTIYDLTSIEITPKSANFSYSSSPVQLTVKGTYASTPPTTVPLNNVKWTSSDTTIATVSSSGVVTFTKKNGPVTISAEYQGRRDSVSTTVSGQASLSSISIIGNLAYSTTPVQLTAKGIYSDTTSATLANVSWSTSAPGIAKVDSSGKVTFTGDSGTVTITATYLTKSDAKTTTVPVMLSSIAINQSLSYSATPVQLTATGTYNNGTTQHLSGVIWTSNYPSIATVDASGKVTFTGLNGSVAITAAYQGKTNTVSTTVNNSLSLVSIAIIQSLSYSPAPVTLGINGYYANGSTQPLAGATWTSSNPSVATVNSVGQVTFTGANGPVTITATYNGLTNSVSTVVDRPLPVQLVSLDINTPFAYSANPVQLVANGVYSDHSTQALSNVSWSSNNPSVATVDTTGRVTFTGTNGTVTITATYNGLTTSVTTTVDRVTTVKLTKVAIFGSLSYSTTPKKLVAIGHYSNNTTEILQNPTWTSSNTDVATVTSKGDVTFTGKDGSVTITAEYQGFKDSVSTTVAVDPEKPSSISIDTYLEYDEDPYQLKLYATYKNGRKVLIEDAVWSSNNTNVAKVSTSGRVTFTGNNGKVTITATYKGLTASVTTTVDSDTVESISVREKFEYDDDTVDLTVRVRYSDGSNKVISSSKVDWSSDNTRVAKVNSKGEVTFTDKEGKVTITAKYKGKTDKVKTTVTSSDIRDKDRSRSSNRSRSSSSSSSSSGSGSGVSYNANRKPFASSIIDTSSVEWNISTLAKNINSMRVSDFSDTTYHWARKEIKLARGLNLTKGDPNGTFKPDAFITREEFVALICRAFQITPVSYGNTFRDTQNSWAKGYIAALVNKGVVKGNQDGTFRPESNITRAEMVTIIYRLLDSRQMPDNGNVYFSDIQNHWARDTITQISRAGLVKGTEYSRFAPEEKTTRAEAIVILLRTLRLSPSINTAISSVL